MSSKRNSDDVTPDSIAYTYFEISIYLHGLQPHIREFLVRKDRVQDVPTEYPTHDMTDQD